MVQNRLQKGDTCMTIKEMSHLHILAIRITNGFVVVGWQSAQTGSVSLCNDLSCQNVINEPISAERHVHQSQCWGKRRSSPACLLQTATHHGSQYLSLTVSSCLEVCITTCYRRTVIGVLRGHMLSWSSLFFCGRWN